MTTRRTYREPMTPGVAMRELRAHAGSQFDPVVVEAALVVLARDEHVGISMTNGADGA
jgi:HD-GYP domain-containing protein (c-di-GMP phosphodiesterase class II)